VRLRVSTCLWWSPISWFPGLWEFHTHLFALKVFRGSGEISLCVTLASLSGYLPVFRGLDLLVVVAHLVVPGVEREGGSCLRLIDSCITQLKVQEPSGTCNASKEEEGSTCLWWSPISWFPGLSADENANRTCPRRSQFENNYFKEMCSGSEAGS